MAAIQSRPQDWEHLGLVISWDAHFVILKLIRTSLKLNREVCRLQKAACDLENVEILY